MTEPTLGNTRLAAERVRLANHAAYHAPTGDVSNVYDRTAALHELLSCAEQLTRVLGGHAARLADAPGLASTDPTPPADLARLAAEQLNRAAARLHWATDLVNEAWSDLSDLYISREETR